MKKNGNLKAMILFWQIVLIGKTMRTKNMYEC